MPNREYTPDKVEDQNPDSSYEEVDDDFFRRHSRVESHLEPGTNSIVIEEDLEDDYSRRHNRLG
jgi:hypothetical protein